jgi:hypothetical protein
MHVQRSAHTRKGDNDLSRENMLAVVPSKLEQMVKEFKTHRCAMDFDHSFVKAIYKEDSPG